MNRATAGVALILLVAASSVLRAQGQSGPTDEAPAVTIPFTQSITVTSATNDTDYRISVGLPLSYESSDESYPALYILDPDLTFGTATEFVRFLSPGELPEIITVGVGYPTDVGVDMNELRRRDFSGNREGFLSFLRDELLPLMDSTYRTTPSDRALLGFSSGGGFALLVFTSEPELFRRYIVISPSSIPGAILLGRVDELREKLAGLNIKVFASAGASESMLDLERFVSVLNDMGLEELKVTSHVVESATHISVLHPALLKGMLSVYCGSNAPSLCGLRVRQGE